jgi:hypothetical protein
MQSLNTLATVSLLSLLQSMLHSIAKYTAHCSLHRVPQCHTEQGLQAETCRKIVKYSKPLSELLRVFYLH